MSAAATIEAINAITALTTVALRSAEAIQQINAIMSRAQTEGRDLTQAEIDEVRSLRGDAMDRWNSGLADADPTDTDRRA